jgi:hypothetical protein
MLFDEAYTYRLGAERELFKVACRIAAAVSFLWFLFDSVAVGWVRHTTDFPNYYTAARMAASHAPLGNFYDYPAFQKEINDTGRDLQLGGYIPQTPLTMLPFMPLAGLEPMTAKRVWLVLNLGFLGSLLYLLTRITKFNAAELWLVVFVGIGALRQNFLLGQYYVLLLATMTTGIYCLLNWKERTAGVLLAWVCLLKLYGAPLFLFLTAKRRTRTIAAGIPVALLSGTFAVALFGLHGVMFYVTQVLPRSMAGETLNPFHASNSTFATLLRRLLLFEPELNPHPLVDAPGACAFLQCVFTLTILALPSLAAAQRRVHANKRELAWWGIASLLVSPNTASYTFVLLVWPVVLLLDELPHREWPYILVPYALLCLPLNPSLSVLSPRAWLLLFLFAVVGRHQLVSINRWAAGYTAAGIVIAGCATAMFVTGFPEKPGKLALPIATQLNAIYSSAPAVNAQGFFFESIQQERYVIQHWQGGRFESFIAPGHSFHPSLPDSGAKMYYELAVDGRSSIGFFDVSDHRFGVVAVGLSDPHDPAISHDGKSLVFISRRELYRFDGRSSRRLAAMGSPSDPSFVPGDTGLVYVSDERQRSRIAGLDLASGKNTVLVDRDAESARPSISRDKSTLLYASRQTGTWQVWAKHLAQSREIQVTVGRCNNFAPAWMQDSGEVVFASDCGRGLNLPMLYRSPLADAKSSSLAGQVSRH